MVKDPNMLLSIINTGLRDQYASLEDLCASKLLDEVEVKAALDGIGYGYDPEQNRFILKQQ